MTTGVSRGTCDCGRPAGHQGHCRDKHAAYMRDWRNQWDQLRADYPTWAFSINWVTCPSGPDDKQFVARDGGETLSARSIPGLREQLQQR